MTAFTRFLCCFLLWGAAASQQSTAEVDSGCAGAKRWSGQQTIVFENAFEAHELSGVVASPSGPSIIGVTVEMIDNSQRCLKATTTDRRGRFNLAITKPGMYKLLLSKEGFDSVLVSVQIRTGSRKDLRIEVPVSN